MYIMVIHMGLHCHMTKSYKAVDTLAPPQTKILAMPLDADNMNCLDYEEVMASLTSQ